MNSFVNCHFVNVLFWPLLCKQIQSLSILRFAAQILRKTQWWSSTPSLNLVYDPSIGWLSIFHVTIFCWLFLFDMELLQVYVIGSSSKLGQWKIQNALKLSYAGDSIWHADCVIQKADFPLKYPFELLFPTPPGFITLASSHTSPFLYLFLDYCFTYRYCKYNKSGKIALETGSNRELSLGTSKVPSRYIFLSDGMMRVSYSTPLCVRVLPVNV